MSSPRGPVVLDASHLDHLSLASGQFRYITDLARGLAALDLDQPFLLLGSRREPAAALAPLLGGAATRWRYRRLSHPAVRGAYWLDQLHYAAALRGEGAALLHATHTFVPLAPACPAVVTVYDLMHELFPEYAAVVRSRAHRRFRHAVQRPGTRVICISQTTADDVARRWGVSGPRVSVVPLGSAFGDVPTEPVAFPPGDPPLVLSPYNLEPRKNLESLLRAVARLVPTSPAIRLVLFGAAAVTPERDAAFNRLVAELGLEQVVLRTGRLTDGQLAAWYERATLFVFPSLYEGFGLPVLEAMSRGACVVARNASAMAEVVGEAGALTPTDRPDALAATIATLLANAERRQTLGAAARRRAATFTIDRMARQTWDVYRAALGAA